MSAPTLPDPIAEGAWVLPLRTPTIPPASTTNTLIVGGERLAVIEPATPHVDEQKRLDQAIAALTSSGREVATVLVTHHHRDHIGYARQLATRLGVPLRAHELTAERVAFDVDDTIDEDWTLDLGDGHVLEPIFTPGHAPGHLVFWDQKTGVAHAGDMIAGHGTILIDPGDGGDMRIYLDSLLKLKQRVSREKGAQLVPAHGPVIDAPERLLQHYVEHRLKREKRVLEAIDDAGSSAEDLLPVAYDDTPRELWPLARLSLEAHLRKLDQDGAVRREQGRVFRES
jgi:glyoxylase-like metal-dependent hydrolase (beta-lactamase superfamily II)